MGISKNSAYPSLLVEGAGVEVMRARVFRHAHMLDTLTSSSDIERARLILNSLIIHYH